MKIALFAYDQVGYEVAGFLGRVHPPSCLVLEASDGRGLNDDTRVAAGVPNDRVFYGENIEEPAGSARGVRYDAPTLGIDWPLPVTVISEKDRNLPRLEDMA